MYFFKKTPPEITKNIGLWCSLIEFVIIISISFNSGLVYFASVNMFNEYSLVINKKYPLDSSEVNIGQYDQALFVIAIVEHLIIGLIYILRFIIPTCSEWIIDENEAILKLIEEDVKYNSNLF